jgi:hypothetical protein
MEFLHTVFRMLMRLPVMILAPLAFVCIAFIIGYGIQIFCPHLRFRPHESGQGYEYNPKRERLFGGILVTLIILAYLIWGLP